MLDPRNSEPKLDQLKEIRKAERRVVIERRAQTGAPGPDGDGVLPLPDLTDHFDFFEESDAHLLTKWKRKITPARRPAR